jgi:hypothetical protein
MATAKTASRRGPKAAKTSKTAKTAAKSASRSKSASRPAGSSGRPRGARARGATPVERALLIPVGAALIARERVASSVGDALSTYSSPTKTQAQLRRFERRGTTARNRLEREVRKARVRFERELRQRRRELEKTVADLEERRDTLAKNGSDLANRVQERLLDLV